MTEQSPDVDMSTTTESTHVLPEVTPTNNASDKATAFHPANLLHLVMGLAFLGMVAVWWVAEYSVLPQESWRYLVPLPWILAGVVGLAVLAAGRGSGRGPERGPGRGPGQGSE